MDIIELILDEENEEMVGIDAVSIVENPAIESDFIALASEEIQLAKIDEEKNFFLVRHLYQINQYLESVTILCFMFTFLKIQ